MATSTAAVKAKANPAVLLGVESFAAPRLLDSSSCDFVTPLRMNADVVKLQDTHAVRRCYRSRRIGLDRINYTNKAFTVFLHGAEADLVYGAVRVTLYRKRTVCPATGTIAVTGSVGDDVYTEAFCITRSITQGVAVGTYVVSGDFDSIAVTIMQPCAGFSLYAVEPTTGDAATPPTVGLTSAQ